MFLMADNQQLTTTLVPAKSAISTVELLTAAVNRLNRQSVVGLLGQLADAIDTCCEEQVTDDKIKAIAQNEVTHYTFSKTLTSLVQVIHTEINTFDFNAAQNTTLGTTIRDSIRTYDYSTSNSLKTTIDARIAGHNYNNVVDARIANYNFSSQVTLNQAFVTKIAEYDFSSHISIHKRFETNNTEVKTWISNAFQSVKGSIENVQQTTVTLSSEIKNVRNEVTNIRRDIDVNVTAINEIKLSMGSVQNLVGIKAQIDGLQKEIQRAVSLAGELDEREIGQVKQIIADLVANDAHVRTIVNNIRINVNNKSRLLMEILQVLVAADHIESVSIDYPVNDDDPKLITGCTYSLTDGTNVKFTCGSSPKQDGSISLEFHTSDWKGLPASFTSTFARRSTKRKICKKEVALDWYEPIKSTNLVFDLFH
jgi:archaellum component FlaC